MDISDGSHVPAETVAEAIQMIKELEDFMESGEIMTTEKYEWCIMRRAELYDELSILRNKCSS